MRSKEQRTTDLTFMHSIVPSSWQGAHASVTTQACTVFEAYNYARHVSSTGSTDYRCLGSRLSSTQPTSPRAELLSGVVVLLAQQIMTTPNLSSSGSPGDKTTQDILSFVRRTILFSGFLVLRSHPYHASSIFQVSELSRKNERREDCQQNRSYVLRHSQISRFVWHLSNVFLSLAASIRDLMLSGSKQIFPLNGQIRKSALCMHAACAAFAPEDGTRIQIVVTRHVSVSDDFE